MYPNYVIFRSWMCKNVPDCTDSFVRSQWDLLRSGVRDVRIHDAACIAWTQCGGRV